MADSYSEAVDLEWDEENKEPEFLLTLDLDELRTLEFALELAQIRAHSEGDEKAQSNFNIMREQRLSIKRDSLTEIENVELNELEELTE
jgi:hypothetical protein